MTLTAVRTPRIGDELGDLAVRMSAVLLGDDTGGSAVQILTSLSLHAVPNAVGAGVTVIGSRGAKTSLAATSETVLEADALQDHLNEGPCLDACLQAAPVLVADLQLDRRWPAWTKSVRPLNIASLMSIPLVDAGRVRGAIKIYCDLPGVFDERAMFLFGELAQTVASLLKPANPPAD
jgi:GAF domain-containing protein